MCVMMPNLEEYLVFSGGLFFKLLAVYSRVF